MTEQLYSAFMLLAFYCLIEQRQRPWRGQGIFLNVSFFQNGQSMWGIRQGPVDEPWLWCGIFLCTDWTAWCFLVLLPPRIYQIHMPDNLEKKIGPYSKLFIKTANNMSLSIRNACIFLAVDQRCWRINFFFLLTV